MKVTVAVLVIGVAGALPKVPLTMALPGLEGEVRVAV